MAAKKNLLPKVLYVQDADIPIHDLVVVGWELEATHNVNEC